MDHGCGLKTQTAIICHNEDKPKLNNVNMANFNATYISPLSILMVKRRNDFLNPISRQNFANAFAETPNLNLQVCLIDP